MTIHLQCLIPKKNGYLFTNTKKKLPQTESSSWDMTFYSPIPSAENNPPHSLEPRGPKPQWEARPAGERCFQLNHLERGRWSQEWGHCKVEITPLKRGWNSPSYWPILFSPIDRAGGYDYSSREGPSCSFEEVKNIRPMSQGNVWRYGKLSVRNCYGGS